jgi:hypothetical protein
MALISGCAEVSDTPAAYSRIPDQLPCGWGKAARLSRLRSYPERGQSLCLVQSLAQAWALFSALLRWLAYLAYDAGQLMRGMHPLRWRCREALLMCNLQQYMIAFCIFFLHIIPAQVVSLCPGKGCSLVCRVCLLFSLNIYPA